ncbi:MAG TPA: helix-turn-helix domain-containing protein [Candidatus Thermoplasmatota archaeon]|nr:helix-turn-helix domain-containing protein [Candidatus Thermoplasmatota archaeon]
MPLTEFVFKVRSEKSLLCEFTRDHRDAQVMINLLRSDAGPSFREALYTILAPRALWQGLLKHFPREYGHFEPVQEHDDYVTVKAPLKLDYARGHNPIVAALEVLGPDAWFHPLLVKDGYLHISVVSPSVQGRDRFMAYTKRMREHVSPDDFKLVHVGPYMAPALAQAREGLTPGQNEVLKMAVALGYYDTPRGCTIEDLAEAFGVSKAAAHKRLKAAENKIIKEFTGAKA